ncbi:hypothetical protein PPERSA_09097 [Pseudocohnilembus persalinus]|uniref:Ubiquitin carboxyl-terminal hydrolase n=1 Tax=Pseudocohnilembus persalinus TaxID=266149 RepID=A0A0V0QWS1_PSEPJ|nr:hypothetical protein PPERSA_09097 [Pseudocohnilembus persalinus]|eukprot:KRX06695.1 hypothetical protein PPERSA_09097 [Pseudocohnilembus persalinus]
MEVETPQNQGQPQQETEKLKLYEKINFVHGGKFVNNLIQTQKQVQNSLNQTEQIQHQLQLNNSWNKVFPIGPGLINKGNTCFLNSVLQALSYTPALASYLLDDMHQKECKKTGKNANNFCCLCTFQTHVKSLFPKQQKCIAPNNIIRNMRYIFKKFRLGRQEDGHEFLRLMVESLQRGALPLNQKLEHNDTISKIFNGKLKSQVKCLSCGYKSEIFENFFDLSLELQNCKDLDQCIQRFFKVEELGGKNKYKCSGCHKFVNAQKRFMINDLPNVLTCHLKRFDNFMRKIHKTIDYPTKVSLKNYVCPTRSSQNANYDLYCVMVHAGGSTLSGHYYCYVKNSNGLWYCMNDETVSQTPINKVLQERAYILFYNRIIEQKPQQQNKNDKQKSVVLEKETQQLENKKQEQNIEIEEQEYKEEQIIIPGDINALRLMKKSKLHKRLYIQRLEEMSMIKKVKKQRDFEEQQEKLILENPEVENIKVNIIKNDNGIQPKKSLLKKQSHYQFQEQQDNKQENQKKTENNFNESEKKELEKAKQEIEQSQKFQDDKNLKKIKNFAGNSLNRARNLTSNWDDLDQDEIEEKNKIYNQNKDILEYTQATKDEYDMEYDKGKVKKVKEKNLEKQVINFQKLFEENKNADFSEEGQLKAQKEFQKKQFKDKFQNKGGKEGKFNGKNGKFNGKNNQKNGKQFNGKPGFKKNKFKKNNNNKK